MAEDCRCGHPANSTEPHPCHYGRLTGEHCGKPAEHFFYAQPGLGKFALAGVQMKMSVESTWGCPEHREWFAAQLKAEEDRLEKNHG